MISRSGGGAYNGATNRADGVREPYSRGSKTPVIRPVSSAAGPVRFPIFYGSKGFSKCARILATELAGTVCALAHGADHSGRNRSAWQLSRNAAHALSTL